MAIDLWLDFLFEVLAIYRLYFPGNLQLDARLPRNIDGKMSALAESEPSNKAEVVLLPLAKRVLAGINAVVDGAYPRHGFALALGIADGDIVDIRKVGIEFAEFWIVRPVKGENRGLVDEPGKGEGVRGLHMNDVALFRGVLNRPGFMVGGAYQSVLGVFDWPL